jgi:RHS repeat-associated protein
VPRRTTWSGAITGWIERSYDSFHALSGLSVNGRPAIVYRHDKDGLPTGAGDLYGTREPLTGRLASTSIGNVTDSRTWDANGDFDVYTARVSGAPVYTVDHEHDALGRIETRIETIGGVTTTYEYGYDAVGRLETVYENGIVVSQYEYDDNGNRLSAVVDGVSVVATYDDQDRLSTYGNRTYTYDPLGNVATVTEGSQVTAYTFDSSSQLRAVTLPSGQRVFYLFDVAGRRVGKKVQAPGGQPVLVRGWLYADGLRPLAELDASGNVVSEFVYATGRMTPEYMIKGDKRYRLIVDHLGSIRLVVDVSTGAIAQRLDYDEYGRILADTSPGFQPFGFAGGLYDGDTGLVHFGAREYDPVIGRWLSRDPIGFDGGDGNLYAYVGNDPVNRIDPFGTKWYKPSSWSDEDIASFGAGLGDVLTFGVSRTIRRSLDYDDLVNPCSEAFRNGEIAGIAASILLGGLAGASRATAAQGVRGFQYSHWIPTRYGKYGRIIAWIVSKRTVLNGNIVTRGFHAITDPYAYQFMARSWKAANPMLGAFWRQIGRIPWVYEGAVVGGGYGILSSSQ